MLVNSILVGLLSLSLVAEASVIRSPFDNVIDQRAARSRTLQARQNRNGGGRGGGGGAQNAGNQNAGGNAAASTSTAAAAASTTAAAGKNTGNNNAASSQCLEQSAIQTGSANDGSVGAAAGQAKSAT